MRRRGIKPNAYTVTSCISALARGGEWERAAQVRCPLQLAVVGVGRARLGGTARGFCRCSLSHRLLTLFPPHIFVCITNPILFPLSQQLVTAE